MGKDGESADISMKIHCYSAAVVGFHNRSSGAAGGAFSAKGCNAACTLIKEGMAKESEIDFKDRYDFDWSEIKDLNRIGPGLLVEVEDEENKILIWLK